MGLLTEAPRYNAAAFCRQGRDCQVKTLQKKNPQTSAALLEALHHFGG